MSITFANGIVAPPVVPQGGGNFNGPVTNTGQPSFLAYVKATIPDVTGNAAYYSIVFDAELWDQTNSFSGSTFTAPVTGKYLLIANVALDQLGTTTRVEGRIVTSNRTYNYFYNAPAGSGGFGVYSGMALADMDAGDTAVSQIYATGAGGNTVDVYGAGSAQLWTYFSGDLLT